MSLTTTVAPSSVDAGAASGTEAHCAKNTSGPHHATEFLRALLANGPISAATVMVSAVSAGYAWRTVQRAADRIGAVRRKDGMRGGWVWALDPDPKAPTANWTHRAWPMAGPPAAPETRAGSCSAAGMLASEQRSAASVTPPSLTPRKPEGATPPSDVLPASNGEIQGRVGEPPAQVSKRFPNKVNRSALLTELGGETSQNLAAPVALTSLISARSKETEAVANQVVATEQRLAALPVSAQITAQKLAEPAPSPSAEAGRALPGAFADHRWRCVRCLAAARMPERFERCPTGQALWDEGATPGTRTTTNGGAA